MSYILDALRKADAQRVRDPARGIHAQPALEPDDSQAQAGFRTGLWVAVAAGTTVLAATAWYLHEEKPASGARDISSTAALTANPIASPSRVEPQPAPLTAPLPAPLPAPPTKVTVAALPPAPAAPIAPTPIQANPPAVKSAAPGLQTPAPAQPMPARPVPTQSLALQAPAPTGPGSLRTEGDPRNTSLPTMRGGPQQPGPGMEPAPATQPQPSTAASPTQSMAPANPAPQQAPAPVARPAPPVAPPPVAPAPSTPAPLVTGLPPDAPKLAISGGVYSSSASQRMLIVNGQVFSEGADIGSGVVLEEIKPKSAVLKFRGTRYTVTY